VASRVVMAHFFDRFLNRENLKDVSRRRHAFSIRSQLGVILFFIIPG